MKEIWLALHRDFKKGGFQDAGICVYIFGLDLLVR